MSERHRPSAKSILRTAALALVVAGCRGAEQAPLAPIPTASHVEDYPNINDAYNKKQALYLLSQVGVGSNFAATDPADIWNANLKLASNPDFNSNFWVSYYRQDGRLGNLALGDDGEYIVGTEGSDNKLHALPVVRPDAKELDAPSLLFTFNKEIDGDLRTFSIVGYANKAINTQLSSLFNANLDTTEGLLSDIFSHSKAKLNILHFGDEGMPTAPFEQPGFENSDYMVEAKDLPPVGISGQSFLISVDGVPKRDDIYINLDALKQEFRLYGVSLLGCVAGMMTNERVGIALQNYQVLQGLGATTGRSEAASTGADWAIRLLVNQGSQNPSFTPSQLDLVNGVVELLK